VAFGTWFCLKKFTVYPIRCKDSESLDAPNSILVLTEEIIIAMVLEFDRTCFCPAPDKQIKKKKKEMTQYNRVLMFPNLISSQFWQLSMTTFVGKYKNLK